MMPETLSTKLNRLAETAKKNPRFQFRTIAHLITVEMLRRSFRELRKDAACGVDGITAKEYEKNLEGNLIDLHCRMKEMRYQAQPLRRVYIPKEDGKQRPLSIPVLEDKIAEKAVVNLLSPIYESDFLPCSYGYRKGRSPHDALQAISTDISVGKTKYVLEADIQDYFGSVVRKQLMEILQKRIGEKNLLRLIGKWLHVGVLDDGRLQVNKSGIHQGSVISPLLANVYLHEVLDLWVAQMVKPRMKGEIKLYRFADDLIICFENKEDAERVLKVLPKRFEKYGLKLHPEKTKLIEFGRSAWSKSLRTGNKPETFDFLGFTHNCGTSRKGKFVVQVRTMRKRLKRSLKKVTEWCRMNRHQPLQIQGQRLSQILRGHYNYYGRRSNTQCIRRFYRIVRRTWWKWLNRRGRKGNLPLKRFRKILLRYKLPQPRIASGARNSQLMLFGELV